MAVAPSVRDITAFGGAVGDAALVARSGATWYRDPMSVLAAATVADVVPVLKDVERAVAQGLHAVGYVAYEAAPAFDKALQVWPADAMPLAWFALYESPLAANSPALNSFTVGHWSPRVSEAAYTATIASLRDRIAAGDTYQVNYTFPLEASFEGDAFDWFQTLCHNQHADHCAFINTGRHCVASVSPELFFRLEGHTLTTKPMKGTRPRGRWPEEDERLKRALRESEKDQAENVMIVDLLRNDMGRISETNSVTVTRLFDVERYPTVWQMTSTIQSQTSAGVPEIFQALFPSGSVTGAPKVETMKIIREAEPEPRGVYCGAVGVWRPGLAEFNVAIRTAVVDTEAGTARYAVGSGITWDSIADVEYAECLEKARVLSAPAVRAPLLETLLYDGAYAYLDAHLDRMARSADYFGYAFDREAARNTLTENIPDSDLARVRLMADATGAVRVESAPLNALPASLRVALASGAVCARDARLFHKTTDRARYDAARNARPDCDDVILWNDRGEMTEGTFANLVVQLDGQKYTPPLESGLLPGILRARLIQEGAIQERVILKSDLANAEGLWLINSVRGWMPAELV